MGIVDFAHKSYQSESGYEALLDEAFRLRLDWELYVVVAFADAMTRCCLVQPSGIVRRWRIHMAEQRCEVKMKAISLCCMVQRSEIVRRWRKRARRKRKRQAVLVLRAKQASLAKVEQEQGQGGAACGAVQRGGASPAGIDTETAVPWGRARGAIRLRLHTLARIATETAVPHG